MTYNKAGFRIKKKGKKIRQSKFKSRCIACGISIGKHDKFCVLCGKNQEVTV